MKTYTIKIDDTLDQTLEMLRKNLGKSTRAEVFRTAIALLKIADDARQLGQKLTVADRHDEVKKEIVMT